MPLLINVLIAAVVALIFYFIATALVVFAHSTLIFGLVALVIFLVLAFGGGGVSTWRGRRGPVA